MERSGLSVPCMASQILAPGHSSSRKPGRQGEWPLNHSPGPACQSAAAGQVGGAAPVVQPQQAPAPRPAWPTGTSVLGKRGGWP